MDPKLSADRVLLAPGAGITSAYELPGRNERRYPRRREIPVDKRLVEPETPWEKIDGKTVYAFPAEAPHADSHVELVYVVRAHVKRGFIGSAERKHGLFCGRGKGKRMGAVSSARRCEPTRGGPWYAESP